jgi:hypothetical protein
MRRLQLGIVLIILSWLPFAQALLYIAHSNQNLTNEQASNEFRLVVWGIQIIIGFIGLWLAGKVAIQEARKDGWKHTGGHLWNLFWHGQNK